MSKLDDIQARIDAKMAEIMRRIDGSAESASKAEVRQQAQPVPRMAGSPVVTTYHANGNRAVCRRMPITATQATDDMEIYNVIVMYVVGLVPGDQYIGGDEENTSTNKGLTDEDWENIVEAARNGGVTLGYCEVKGNGKHVDDKEFMGPTEFCRAPLGHSATTDQEETLSNVEKVVSYYFKRWHFSEITDVCILWTWAEAKRAQNGCNYDIYDVKDNAFSLARDMGKTFLCFTPGCHDFETAAHEFTHSVTRCRIGWGRFYKDETGAINESFSDIFAKFTRWHLEGIQEDERQRWIYSGCRNMAHPDQPINVDTMPVPAKGGGYVDIRWIPASYYLEGCQNGVVENFQTDKGQTYGYGWYPYKAESNDNNDNGGVHINNGVIARLCYLLCEGEKFKRNDGRSFDVQPIGFDRTEKLFGRLVFGGYLPENCTMYVLYNKITLAAKDLKFEQWECERIQVACDAVNIVPIEASSKLGNLSMEDNSMRNAIPGAAGTSHQQYANVLTEMFASELGLNVAGAGFTVDKESVIEMPDLHAAVPTGGEVQVAFSQTWHGLPVFASHAVARVRDGERVTYFQNGFSSALGQLVSHTTVDESSAKRAAEAKFPGSVASSVRKIVYDPALIGNSGTATVAWQIDLKRGEASGGICIVSANDGSVLYSQSARIVD